MLEVNELLRELTSGDDARAEAAALVLAGDAESSLPILIPLLASSDPDHRWWAVRTLGAMKEPRNELLRAALRDGAAEVRAAAALALAAHPTDSAIPELVTALDDEDSLVSTLSVNALVSIGKASVPALLEAFPTGSQRARIHVMRALAAIKDPTAIATMLKASEDDSAMLSYWAREGLDALGLSMVYLMPE